MIVTPYAYIHYQTLFLRASEPCHSKALKPSHLEVTEGKWGIFQNGHFQRF